MNFRFIFCLFLELVLINMVFSELEICFLIFCSFSFCYIVWIIEDFYYFFVCWMNLELLRGYSFYFWLKFFLFVGWCLWVFGFLRESYLLVYFGFRYFILYIIGSRVRLIGGKERRRYFGYFFVCDGCFFWVFIRLGEVFFFGVFY